MLATPPKGCSGNDAGLRWLCSRVRGEVLEVGIGRGRTLSYYPAGVHLTGVDISPISLAAASERARSMGINASLREADASEAVCPIGPMRLKSPIPTAATDEE